MSERTIVNRYSSSSLLALVALVVAIGFLSAGCALSSRTALPGLPPVPVLTITTVSVVSPGFTNTIYPPPAGGPNLGRIIATAGGTPPLSSCSIVNDTVALFDQLPPGLSIMPSGTSYCIIAGTISATAPLGTYTCNSLERVSNGNHDSLKLTTEGASGPQRSYRFRPGNGLSTGQVLIMKRKR